MVKKDELQTLLSLLGMRNGRDHSSSFPSASEIVSSRCQLLALFTVLIFINGLL